MILKTLIILLVNIFYFSVSAQTPEQDFRFDTLAGELPVNIVNRGIPYLILEDITIQPGTCVTIEPGVVFLFKNFTGLQVHGTLLAKGSQDFPIIFTSENDRRFVPFSDMEAAPYDWNGITFHENAFGTTLEWCAIENSLFGINSLTEHINIKSCYFQQNGRSDLIVSGKQIDVSPNPYTSLLDPGTLPSSQALTHARPLVIRYNSLMLLFAGAAGGAWKTIDFMQSEKEFESLSNYDDHKTERGIADRWETTRRKRNNDFLWMCAGYGIAFLGAVGFSLSFAF